MNKKNIKSSVHYQKKSLNFWHLSFIIFGSIGLAGVLFGHGLAKEYGANNCIGSFIIANLINWLIGMTIISMSAEKKVNAISNIKNYLGKKPSLLAALCIMFSFLSWYIFQLNKSNISINAALDIKDSIFNLRSGAALGIFATLLMIGGLRNIKYVSMISSGVIIFVTIYFFINNNALSVNPFGFSFKVFGSALFFLLPAMLNLPTFFRYSRSKADSFLALTIIFIVLTFILISSIWIENDNFLISSLNKSSNYYISLKLFLIFLIILITTSCLMVNIFFASACWEFVISKFTGPKEYAVIGLLGTALFTFLQITPPIEFLMDLANYYVATLVVILIITYVGSIIKSDYIVKLLGGIAWLIGCFTATILEYNNPNRKIYTLSMSIAISCLFFVISFFLEESIWATKKIIKRKK